jgi:hypothetical protein
MIAPSAAVAGLTGWATGSTTPPIVTLVTEEEAAVAELEEDDEDEEEDEEDAEDAAGGATTGEEVSLGGTGALRSEMGRDVSAGSGCAPAGMLFV